MTRYTCRITASKEKEAVKFFFCWGGGFHMHPHFTLHPIIMEGVSAIKKLNLIELM